MAVQISGNDITVPRDGTFTRNVTIGGTLTYEDVTNIDSVGLVTARNGIEIGARPGVAASISVDGNMIVSGISTFNGRVLLGTTTEGSANADDLTVANSGEGGITIRTGSSANGNIFFSDGTTGAAEYAGFIDYKHGSDAMTFGTSGSEKVRIDSNGRVGIGTDTVYNPLEVVGSSADILVYDTDAYSQNVNGGALAFAGKDSAGVRKTLADVRGVANGSNVGEFAIRTRKSGGTLTEALRITSTGSVSFKGDANPQALFDRGSANNTNINLNYNGTLTGQVSAADADFQLSAVGASTPMSFYVNGAEKLSIRASDGRVTITNDMEFSSSGNGGIFGKFAFTNQAYTANANLDIALTQGNYIFSVRSGGVYHYNAVFVVTYYDAADKNSVELLHGDYGTTATHTVIHNGNNNGTFRLTFNRNFDGINVRQLKLS